MSESLEWQEPPTTRARTIKRPRYADMIDVFKAHPREWARIGIYETVNSAASKAKSWRYGDLAGIQAGEFEAVTRKLEDGSIGVWVRYVGEDA